MIRPDSFRFTHLGRPTPPGPPTAGETAPAPVSPANLSESTTVPTTAASVGKGRPALASEHTPGQAHPCCGGYGEHFTHCHLVATVTDRHGTRYVSPLGDTRQRAASCRRCGDPDVWALDATCDRCAIDARSRALTHLTTPAKEALL